MPASIPKGIFCFKVVWTIFFFLFAISQIISNLLECINQHWHTVKLMPKKQNWQSWTASLFYFSGCFQTYHFVQCTKCPVAKVCRNLFLGLVSLKNSALLCFSFPPGKAEQLINELLYFWFICPFILVLPVCLFVCFSLMVNVVAWVTNCW